MRTVRLIVNPAAGPSRGRARRGLEREIGLFRAAIEGAGHRFELCRTTGPGGTSALAVAAVRDGVSDLVAAGGDGTIADVASGLLACDEAPSPRLGLWPRGTANVLARELGCPGDPVAAAGIVLACRTRSIQPGLLAAEGTGRSRVFFLMAGAGLDAQVLARVHPGLKGLVGQAAFWWAGLTLPWRPVPFEVEAGGRSFPATFLCVGRSPRYGGGFSVTPAASLDRADFQVAVVNVTRRARMAALLCEAFRSGLSHRPPEVTLLRATAVRASGAPVALQADGDPAGMLPARFRLAARAIEILVPSPD